MNTTTSYFHGGCLHGQVKEVPLVIQSYQVLCNGKHLEYKSNRFISLRNNIVYCARVFWVQMPPSVEDLKKSIPEHAWMVMDV